jgi:hypothetical protein
MKSVPRCQEPLASFPNLLSHSRQLGAEPKSSLPRFAQFCFVIRRNPWPAARVMRRQRRAST